MPWLHPLRSDLRLEKFAGILFFLFMWSGTGTAGVLGAEESWKMRIADGERFKTVNGILLVSVIITHPCPSAVEVLKCRLFPDCQGERRSLQGTDFWHRSWPFLLTSHDSLSALLPFPSLSGEPTDSSAKIFTLLKPPPSIEFVKMA